jgi:hypothetical protein
MRPTVVALVLAVLLPAAAVLRCGGPRPEVVATELRPGPDGARPAAIVRNGGRDGEVEVRFRALDRSTGRRVASDVTAQLVAREEAEVLAPAPLPPGEWVVDAEAEYPPE